MQRRVLSESQIERFVDDGYLVVEDCFDPAAYGHWLSDAMATQPGDLKDPSSWKPYLEQSYRPGHVRAVARHQLECERMAPKLWMILCDLLGEERIRKPYPLRSIFELNLGRYSDSAWQGPGRESPGWHLDLWERTSYLDHCWPTILPFLYWSDVQSREGGVFICPDSLRYVAARLRDNPQGLNKYGELSDATTWRTGLASCERFVELTAKAGSVAFVHGMVLHAESSNKSGVARVMSREIVELDQPPRFDRESESEFSPYERSILNALGASRIEFERVAPEQFRKSQFSDGKAVALHGGGTSQNDDAEPHGRPSWKTRLARLRLSASRPARLHKRETRPPNG